jgi:hypothetical protein
MPLIDERARHELFVAVQDTLGPNHADTLMSLLPPVGWADVATKHDLHELEDRLTNRFEPRFGMIDQRFEAIEKRFDRLDQRFDAMEKRFDRLEKEVQTVHLTLTTQTRMIAVTVISSMVGMAAVCVGALAFLA